MSGKLTVPALLAGASITAVLALTAPASARPLPVQSVESLAGDSSLIAVQARQGRVVRSTRVVKRGRVVRTYRAAPRRAAYRYLYNRNAALAA